MAVDPRHFASLTDARILGSFNQPITGAAVDSRFINEGDLFVAFVGAHVDGHDYIKQAISRGASAVMASPTWADASTWSGAPPLILVEDPVQAMGELACRHRQEFSIPVIAITGSNGKTTTKNMLADILSQRGSVLATAGNFNNQIGLPLTVLRLDASHDFAVLEFGASHPGDITYLAEIAGPTLGTITSISSVHTEFLGDLDGVQRVKGELFDYLDEHGGWALVNHDDPRIRTLGRLLANSTSYSFRGEGDLQYTLSSPDDQGCYALILPDGTGLHLSQPGEPTAWNAACAASLAHILETQVPDIVSALESYGGEPGRMQRIQVGDITVIHDAYNANPASFRASLKSFRIMQTAGRKVLVMGDMLELGKTSSAEHTVCAETILASDLDRVYLVGSNTAHTAHRLNGTRKPSWFHSVSRIPAVKDFLEFVKPGDLVLLKGSRGMGLEAFLDALKGRM